MSKMPELEEHLFKVTADNGAGLFDVVEVQAAYFQETGRYTVLKDGVHIPVAAYRTDLVCSIVRVDDVA